jgi:restriction system protein
MITNHVPVSWQALQNEVALILGQCGFAVNLEKTISLTRGEVEVDVYAEELVNRRKYAIICECKYWKSKIPQHVIHSFRSVIQDSGANIGYIISTLGFQSGSKKASAFTNIELLTWSEFQEKFFESWYFNYFSPAFTKSVDSFLTYTEPILPKWYALMIKDDQMRFNILKERYDILGPILMRFTVYSNMLKSEKEIVPLPIWNWYAGGEYENIVEKLLPRDILTSSTYREFMEVTLVFIHQALTQFRHFKYKYHNEEEEF